GERVAAEMVATLYDASLDEFVENNWNLNPYPTAYAQRTFRKRHFNSVHARRLGYGGGYKTSPVRNYPTFNRFTYAGRSSRMLKSMQRASQEVVMSAAPEMEMQADQTEMAEGRDMVEQTSTENTPTEDRSATTEGLYKVAVRKNLKETVFFFPNLKTDEAGNILISFIMNEALTKWKFLGLAHTQDLQIGTTENSTITQKELMVQPNAPRFLREGDDIVFTAKVSNLTENAMNGTARIELLDATTMQVVNALFDVDKDAQAFVAEAGQSARLAWKLRVPSVAEVPVLVHRVVAKTDNFSDGEESTLPILTNRMLVTETMPLPVRAKKKKEFTFASLDKANTSNTLEHQRMTLEFTSNPAWYAVQALPYLMEYPHDCIEQVFSRYYANSLASSIANAYPRIQSVFEAWKDQDAVALQSNLSKNDELKYALLEETPWVMDAQNEAEQKRNVGLLFDLTRMAAEQDAALENIIERQLPDGGFSWFKGGYANWYMTQHLVAGFGHLDKLGVKSVSADARVLRMLDNAVRFLDEQFLDYYKKHDVKQQQQIAPLIVHYLYTRSFFLNYPIEGTLRKAVDAYLEKAGKSWLKNSVYEQGMLALATQRMGQESMAMDITKSLKERAIQHQELGMYWKLDVGYYWYQLPIETHALMIEVFDEVAKDSRAVEDLKIWLLKAKQTSNWKTTKATAAAVYALLMNGDNWLLEDKMVEVTFNNAGNPEIHESKLK
ncbi:MAG: alpha-2-macroglobulin family protein, partial [Bacteroidota bacterium]